MVSSPRPGQKGRVGPEESSDLEISESKVLSVVRSFSPLNT